MVISLFSKILERIVHDHVGENLNANKVLGMSLSLTLCNKNLLIDSTNYWYENIDNKQFYFSNVPWSQKGFWYNLW